MRFVKVWKEPKDLSLLLTSDKLVLDHGLLHVFVAPGLHVLIRVAVH